MEIKKKLCWGLVKNYVINDLFDYKNRYIFQPTAGFKFSLDSILLAEFVKYKNNADILDMCSGNGAVPLIMSTKTTSHIDAIEIQKEIYELALASIKYNKLEKYITMYNGDAKELEKYIKDKKYDIITCNPPYFEVNSNVINESAIKSIARHELKICLEDIIKIASERLKNNGVFYLVHVPSRLDEIIIFAAKYNIRVKEIQLIITKKAQKPAILLVKCVKGAKKGMIINKIIDVENYNSYQHLFKEEV